MCSCSQFDDLEFLRKVITKRIKESRPLKKTLLVLAKQQSEEHNLYRCEVCGQFWQGSRAWDWGNDEYLFKVPAIDLTEWKSEVYVQPDELLIFTTVVSEFLTRGGFTETASICRTANCEKKAVSGSVNCLLHHLESLQRVRMMPAYPVGRWFGPYIRENIIPAL